MLHKSYALRMRIKHRRGVSEACVSYKTVPAARRGEEIRQQISGIDNIGDVDRRESMTGKASALPQIPVARIRIHGSPEHGMRKP